MNITPGSNSNITPDYMRHLNRELAKSNASAQPGAILSKDSLEVSYVNQFPIRSNDTQADRPVLAPLLFRQGKEKENSLADAYYQELREQLPIALKEKLDRNEKETEDSQKDMDCMALAASLRFQANLLALSDTVSIGPSKKNTADAELYATFPVLMQQEMDKSATTLSTHLTDYLTSIGKNHPSHEILSNVYNQIQESIRLLKSR